MNADDTAKVVVAALSADLHRRRVRAVLKYADELLDELELANMAGIERVENKLADRLRKLRKLTMALDPDSGMLQGVPSNVQGAINWMLDDDKVMGRLFRMRNVETGTLQLVLAEMAGSAPVDEDEAVEPEPVA